MSTDPSFAKPALSGTAGAVSTGLPQRDLPAPAATLAAAALPRLAAFARQVVPQVQYRITQLGVAGQAGLAALVAAAVIVFSVLLPARQALHRLDAELLRAAHAPSETALQQAVPRLMNALPTRAQMPGVVGQVFAQAQAAGVSLDSGKYVYAPGRGTSIGRYELEFPVKARYVNIRTFIDRTLSAVPAASLDKLHIERKAVGDAVVNAEIGFVVFVRGETAP